jgi:hypothetical protein
MYVEDLIVLQSLAHSIQSSEESSLGVVVLSLATLPVPELVEEGVVEVVEVGLQVEVSSP